MSKAFIEATKKLLEGAYKSMSKNEYESLVQPIYTQDEFEKIKAFEKSLIEGQLGLGTIESIWDNQIKIKKEEWAPGIWAGTDGGLIVAENGLTYKIELVDLEFRNLYLNTTQFLYPGDKILRFR